MSTHLCFQVFLIYFYLILFCVHGQCQNDQRSILIQLKSSLQFNSSSSTKLVSWSMNDTNCCNWRGVNCSSGGEVIGLDLSNETISGGINDSSAIFSLKNLENLNLAGNNFNFTQIPTGFGSLISLKYLNLSNSFFSGQVPGELTQLTRLEVLDLSSLFFFRVWSLKLETPNLSMLVRNLTQLRELYLDRVNISAQKLDWGQALSSSLPYLEVLSLSHCQLSGPLDGSLQNMQSLSVIRLAGNDLSSPVPPDFFAKFSNLSVMDLGSCHLEGIFPKKVLQLQSLQILDLSDNMNLSGSLLGLPRNGALRSLVLSNTNFSGRIPEFIEHLENLSHIDLRNCRFNGRIPKTMENLTQLSYLDLSSNNFIGQIPSFRRCKNLTHVDLSRNPLSGSIPSTHFQDLQNLVFVDLSFNAFNGRIPSSLFSLQQVQKIQLSSNNFGGPLPNFSDPSASLLDTLDLSSNKLEGKIPSSFFELGKLSVLLLSSNSLSGLIQTKDFQGLHNLTTLDLSFNNLTINTSYINTISRLPKFSSLKLASCNLKHFPNLKNQSRMTTLDLSDNKISGTIPSWIWNVGNGSLINMNLSRNQLTSLEEPYNFAGLSVLDLHFNNLSGTIPVPPETATFIDYSYNHFSSSLPKTIGESLTYAYFFSVANNFLTDMIPDSICSASYLAVLDLSSNRLTGRIPKCLIEFGGSLGVLNLGNNNLTGEIEGTFPRSCQLETLDLRENHLEGVIPRSLVNCTMLEVLNLGNNRINDIYPCSLRNITNLRVLVLRSNMFHGYVNCSLSEPNRWSKLQIVDISRNNFSGIVPEKCFWQWDAMMADENGVEPNKKHLSFNVLQFSGLYYQDTVTVTIKGLELELVKILTLFTSIDISSNRFSGEIPRTIGKLSALYLLNISHNEFTGSIPPSIGNLSQLEALDMSSNKLIGDIPSALANLLFLSFLNLSYNQLEGRIPTGNQLQTFSETSYIGNKQLCGFPLNRLCPPPVAPTPKLKESKNGYDWRFIFTGVGFGAGAAIVMGPLMLSKQGRQFWDKHTNKLIEMICLILGIRYMPVGVFDEDENAEKESLEDNETSDESELESEDDQSKRRYCVFCTKLDFYRKRAIHDPKCTCFDQTSFSSYSSEAESPFSKL